MTPYHTLVCTTQGVFQPSVKKNLKEFKYNNKYSRCQNSILEILMEELEEPKPTFVSNHILNLESQNYFPDWSNKLLMSNKLFCEDKKLWKFYNSVSQKMADIYITLHII